MKLIPGEWRYVDDDGTFLPWYTGPCLDWLKTLDLKGKWVFEYGVGDSTLWFKNQGAKVWGVDSNMDWAITHGVRYATEKEHYTKCAHENKYFEMYNIIVIDGDFMDDCTWHALKSLKPGGFLIIDNFEQPSFECDWTKTKELIKDMDQVLFKEPDHPSGWATLVVKK